MFKKKMGGLRDLDENEYRMIFEQYYKQVYNVAFSILQDPYLAQDVVQETFIKAFSNLHQVYDREGLGSWLSTIASRTAIDVVRKRNRWNDVPVEPIKIEIGMIKERSFRSVEEELEEKWKQNEVRGYINQLPPEFRAVILLKYIYGLKEEEIAKILGLNTGTVKSRLNRGKKKLENMIIERGTMEGGVNL